MPLLPSSVPPWAHFHCSGALTDVALECVPQETSFSCPNLNVPSEPCWELCSRLWIPQLMGKSVQF